MEIPRLGFLFIFFTLSYAQNYTLPDHVVPERYALTIHVRSDSTIFIGFLSLYFNTTKSTNELNLHATPGKMKMLSLIYDKSKCNVTAQNNETEIIKIVCPKNFTETNNLITIIYQGFYSTDGRGLFKSFYHENGISKVAIATQMEPTFARRVFPCLDEPRFKAIFDVTIVHPENYTVIGNGMLKGESDFQDGNGTTFQSTPAMSTYLVAFLVSEFEESKTNTSGGFSIYTRPDAKEFTSTALEYGLPLIYTMGNWTNIDYFKMGIPKMTQVALQTLPIEAMENWGLITYEEMDQIDEGNDTTIDQKQRIVTTMAHELAHQWFGDLVTMDWWSNTWLNEGFATYFEYHLPALLDNFNFDLENQFVSKICHSVLLKDSFPSSPLSNKDSEILTADKIQGKFDEISYSKGACIIRMIKGILGEKVFQEGIREYLSKNRYSNTNPKQLLQVLDNNYKNKSYSLNETMVPFIYQSGYPLLTVKTNGKNQVTITQEQFSLVKGHEQNSTWYVPISYTTSSEKKFNIKINEWLKPKQTLNITLGEKDWIVVNLQQIGYFRVNYEDTLWDRLISALKKNKSDIHVLNRAQLVDDIFNIARAGKVSYDKVFHLAEYLQTETEYYPWVAYFDGISFILDHTSDTDTIVAIKNLTLTWINKAFPYSKVITPTPIEVLRRVLINEWKCRFEDSDCLSYVKSSFKSFMNTSHFPNYNERHLVLCNFLRSSSNSDENFDSIFEIFDRTDSAYARRVFLDSLGCTSSATRLKELASNLTKDSDDREFTNQEAPTVIKAIINNGYDGVNCALDLLAHWTIFINETYQGFFTVSDIVTLAASKINNEKQLTTLQNIMKSSEYKEYMDEDVNRKANETMMGNMVWSNTYKKDIKTVVVKLNGGPHPNRGHMLNYSAFVIILTSLLSLFVF